MTKKDFILIADVIKDYSHAGQTKEVTASKFANALQRTNPNFNKERFIKHCLKKPE